MYIITDVLLFVKGFWAQNIRKSKKIATKKVAHLSLSSEPNMPILALKFKAQWPCNIL